MVLCCGDCAKEIVDAGGRIATEVTTLPLGPTCQVHPPHKGAPPVTNAVVPPEGWERVANVDGAAEPFRAPPREMGPVTQIAAQLVAQWSREDKCADDLMVQFAVDAAHRILKLTDGA